MKKIEPCRVLKKFGANAYEIELPDGIGISPIFNVSYLYPYKAEEAGTNDEQSEVHWKKQMPVAEKATDRKHTRQKNWQKDQKKIVL
jgi:hypothetical protein